LAAGCWIPPREAHAVARVKFRVRPAHRTNAGGGGGKGELRPWVEEALQPRGRCRGRGGHRWGADVGGSVRPHGGGGGRTRPGARRSGPDRAAALMLLLRRRNTCRLPIQGVEGGGRRIRRMAGNTAAGGGGFRRRVDAKLGRWRHSADEFCGWEEAASFALEAADRGRLTRSVVGPGSGPIPWVHFPYCSNQTHEIQTRKFFPSSQPNKATTA